MLENIDKDNLYNELTKLINNMFDSKTVTLSDDSKTFILTALITYCKVDSLDVAGIKFDYTSVITPLIKALEKEIKTYIKTDCLIKSRFEFVKRGVLIYFRRKIDKLLD